MWSKPSWLISRLPAEETLPLRVSNEAYNGAAEWLSGVYKTPIKQQRSSAGDQLRVAVKADAYVHGTLLLFDTAQTDGTAAVDVNKVSSLVKRFQGEAAIPANGQIDGVTLAALHKRRYPNTPSLKDG